MGCLSGLSAHLETHPSCIVAEQFCAELANFIWVYKPGKFQRKADHLGPPSRQDLDKMRFFTLLACVVGKYASFTTRDHVHMTSAKFLGF